MKPNIFSRHQPAPTFNPAVREAAWRRLGFTPENTPSGCWSQPPIDLELVYRGRAIEITPVSPAGVDFLDGPGTLVVAADDFKTLLGLIDAAGLAH